jgi:hypothetical protein
MIKEREILLWKWLLERSIVERFAVRYFKVHSALLHLERDFAASYVTVGGENLPAKYVGSLGETVAGCR